MIIITYFGILYDKLLINAAKEVKSIGWVIIWHMTLFAQLVVFKGCMAWSSWSGSCEECKNGQYRQRVGKWQEGVFQNLWLESAKAGFRHCFTNSSIYIYSIYKLLFNWINSYVSIAMIIRQEPSAVIANGCFLY